MLKIAPPHFRQPIQIFSKVEKNQPHRRHYQNHGAKTRLNDPQPASAKKPTTRLSQNLHVSTFPRRAGERKAGRGGSTRERFSVSGRRSTRRGSSFQPKKQSSLRGGAGFPRGPASAQNKHLPDSTLWDVGASPRLTLSRNNVLPNLGILRKTLKSACRID